MNEQAIFLAALETADPAERAAGVTRACAGDAALRRQVEALLAAHDRSGDFLAVPILRQMAPGGPEDSGAPTVTSVDGSGGAAGPDVDLAFLQPSAAPGSLGRLRHYDVREVIGRGGCGIVLKAFDESLHRMVAVKVMAPELSGASPARKRFLREARAAAAVRHENVVSIHAVEDQPVPFLVMEYIAGQSLQQKIDEAGPLDAREVARIGQQIAAGLAAAHATGLIHRDIKPANILMDGERVKITDFGLARTGDDASLTQSGVIAGTPLYMSPEQSQGAEIDQRSDLFSLGSVLYVMCCGRPPFRAATTLAVLKRVAEDQPRPVREIIPETPESLTAVIATLHAKRPADRYASAHDVALRLAELHRQDRLEVSSAGRPVPPAPAPDRATRPATFGRRWAAAAAVLVAMSAGLGLTEAAGVTDVRGTAIRLFSADGTLLVEVDDPDVSVTIDGEDVVITGAGAKEIRLKPGQYKVSATKDGKVVRRDLITVTRNGRQVVRVSAEAGPAAADIPRAAADGKPAFVSGDWGVAGDVVRQRGMDKAAMLLFGKPDFTDGDFTCEILHAGPADTLALVVRAADADNYYYAEIGGFGNKWHSVYAKEAGTNWRRVDMKPTTGVPLDRWVSVRVTLRGEAIEVFVDGRRILSGKDDRRLKGYVGLRTWNSAGQFRNPTVTDPAGKVLWRGLPALPAEAPAVSPDRRAAEYVFSVGGLVQINGVDRYLSKAEELPTGPFCLTSVFAEWKPKLDDAGLEAFKGCKDVTSLRLWGTAASARGLAHFKDCRGLTELGLTSDAVTDAALEHFKDCPDLTTLAVQSKNVTDAGLAHFRACKKLTTLSLPHTQVTDAGLAAFNGCKSLKSLTLGDTGVTDAGLAHFKDCKDLESLLLFRTKVTDAGLADFRDCKKLKSLNLHGLTRVTDAGLVSFKNCETLTTLLLADTGVTDAGLAQFKNYKNLSHLSLSSTPVTDAGLAHLKECKLISELELARTKVTDAGLIHLKGWPSLTRLHLDGAAVTDKCVAVLGDMWRLKLVNLRGGKVTSAGLKKLAAALPLCRIEWDGGVFEPAGKP